jgi:hypothetical protein
MKSTRPAVWLVSLGSIALLSGCPKSKGVGPDASADAASSAADAAAAAAAQADASTAAPGAVVVDGVGEIPPWVAAHGKGKSCKMAPAAKERMKKLGKGEDDPLTNNSADPVALEKEVAADCDSAQRALVEALNNGGFAHYGKKKYKEAARWWRAALVVRPSAILPRYNLACGLALDGEKKQSVREISEIGRAADDGEATAANFLEKAKSDGDLATVRDDPDFKQALKSSSAGLVGPRKEPETATEGAKLLPDSYRKGTNPATRDAMTYKPALLQFWTWRPAGAPEMLVATVVHDPATVGKPKGDVNADYGAIAVLQRDAGKLKLLFTKKTGESPPSIAAGKDGSVLYSFVEGCGDLRGKIVWKDGKLAATEAQCGDDPGTPMKPVASVTK